MAIGMTYEQFWYGDPWMVKTFEKAHELKKDILNQQMWLQGLYIQSAVQSVVGTALGKRTEYIKQPLNLHPEKDKEKARQKAIQTFEAMRLAWMRKGETDGSYRSLDQRTRPGSS